MTTLITQLAHAIWNAQRHTLALTPASQQHSPTTEPSALAEHIKSIAHLEPAAPIYVAAYQACLALDFIPDDAACLARAWLRMANRVVHSDTLKPPSTDLNFRQQNQNARIETLLDYLHHQNPTAWPHLPSDFELRTNTPSHATFAACPHQLGLYTVVPDARWVARMAQAAVPTIQLRIKSDDPTHIRAEINAAIAAVKNTRSLLFINDHWQAALDAGAYGIHLGQEDIEALTQTQVAHLRASGMRLGLSTHGYAEMQRADQFSPSYIALGAVFPTTLKKMATAPQGTGRLGAYASLMQHYPLVAIGGIGYEQLDAVLGSGVGSIAVVRAITAAKNPEAEALRFMQKIQKMDTPNPP